MTTDSITVQNGILSINGQPQIRFPSTAWALVFLVNLGYGCTQIEAETWTLTKAS